MKNYKYIGLLLLMLGFFSCDVNSNIEDIPEDIVPEVALNTGGLDFSKYVAIGASFTAGITDGALFKASQENSFPNILAKKFGIAESFSQPLMNDNIGGLAIAGTRIGSPRLVFGGAGPVPLESIVGSLDVSTDIAVNNPAGPFNNLGVPGAKSFHLFAPGYGNIAGVLLGAANPYFVRMASNPNTTVIGDAVAQSPTFFTLSEIGGNDVLSYATSGGAGVDQSPTITNPTGNLDPTTYGGNDITNPLVFASIFGNMLATITAGGAKGVVANVPYVSSLPFFTSVPYDALDPTNPELAAQIPTLNAVYGSLNQIFSALGESNRMVTFSTTQPNPIVIKDENLVDLSKQITGALIASPTFPIFVQSFGLPPQAAPLVAVLLGNTYGQSRPATADDLFVLTSSSVIATINEESVKGLMLQGLPEALAQQFSAEGVTLPMADKWVLTPEEQTAIKTATDAYNTIIESTVATNPNVALINLKEILQEASTSGIKFDGYQMNTSLVFGGLVSLDGIHLTARGYALMANKILEAIDAEFGSNFKDATNGLAKAEDYPTNYSPLLK